MARPVSATQPLKDDTLRTAAREMVRVALPAVVTMMSYVVMQFVDMLIVSRLGSDALAAVGNGGIAAFTGASIMFGVLGVINTYVSQNLGAGRPERGSAYAWNGLWLNVIVCIFVFLPYAMVLPQVFSAMRGVLGLEINPAVARMEVEYGRILVLGMFFVISARGMANFFYGVHRANTVMVSALVANTLNVPLTWALVFGAWGLPELGVAGAAWGTLISSVLELLILLAVFLSPAYHRMFSTRSAWQFSGRHIRDIMKIGWPAGLMTGNELTCWWIFMSGMIAHFGVAHNAAGWIVLRYMHVSFMPTVGLSIAVTAVVGKAIGRGRHDLAAQRAWLGMSMAMAFMGACALAFVIFREPMIALFAEQGAAHAAVNGVNTAEVIRIGSTLLILAAGFQLFDAVAITLVGALRGAGDTIWPGVVTAILSWVLIIGLGFLLVREAPQLESLGPWIAAASYIIVLSIFLLARFLGGKWKSISLLEEAPAVDLTLPCIECEAILLGEPGDGVCPSCGAPVAALAVAQAGSDPV